MAKLNSEITKNIAGEPLNSTNDQTKCIREEYNNVYLPKDGKLQEFRLGKIVTGAALTTPTIQRRGGEGLSTTIKAPIYGETAETSVFSEIVEMSLKLYVFLKNRTAGANWNTS